MFKILGKIAIIIFVVEGLIMVVLAGIEDRIPALLLPILDAGSLTLLSIFPVFYWVIRPYVLSSAESNRALMTESAEKTAIVETAIEGIISINEKGIIKTYNPAAEKLFGYSKDEILDQSVNMLMVDDDKRKHDGYMSNYSKTGVTNIMGVGRELCGKRKDGTEFPMHLAINEMKLSGNRMFVGVMRDLTEQKLTTSTLTRQVTELVSQRKEIEEKQELLQKIMDNTGRGIVVFNRQLRLVAWNATFLGLMKLGDEGYFEGMSIEDFFQLNLREGDEYDQTIEEYIADLHERIKNRTDSNELSRDRLRPDGTIINSAQIIMRDGTVINSYRDVTAERMEEERIKAMALRDGLTDLGNRRAFNAQLEGVIDKYRQSDTPFILAYIDLDNFKSVNDTHGHIVGDAVLKFVSGTIKKHIRNTDIAIRFGGDEFAIIYTGTRIINPAIDRLGKIISDIKGKKSIDNASLDIGASAGLACCPGDGTDIQTLMEAADTALYMAKEKGKGRVYYEGKS